jgi:hypothetical protein
MNYQKERVTVEYDATGSRAFKIHGQMLRNSGSGTDRGKLRRPGACILPQKVAKRYDRNRPEQMGGFVKPNGPDRFRVILCPFVATHPWLVGNDAIPSEYFRLHVPD